MSALLLIGQGPGVWIALIGGTITLVGQARWSSWKGGVLRKLLPRILFLLGGLVAGLVAGLLLPAAQRLRLSRQLAAGIGRVAEQMPDG